MSRDSSGLGQGRLWSIESAELLTRLPMDLGLGICATHAEFSAEVYRENENAPGIPTQLKAVERFADGTDRIISNWRNSGGTELPVEHEDLAFDLSPHTMKLGDRVYSKISFDPDVRNVSTAVHRLRTVRMAIPEILRKYLPSVGEAFDAGLNAVESNLITITDRGRRQRTRSGAVERAYRSTYDRRGEQ